MAEPAAPRPASSTVVLRDTPEGPTVLLVRRHDRSASFAGASVFPGGTLDPGDSDPEWASDTDRFDDVVAPAMGIDGDLANARAWAVAACRELFEETGILLARRPTGEPALDEERERVIAARALVHAGERAFRDVLAEHGLVLALDELVPLARWITPVAQPRRWDTRFFVVAVPHSDEGRADGIETSSAIWQRAADALDAYRTGETVLAPPTYRILEDLSRFGSVGEALEVARREAPPPTILPVPLEGTAEVTLVYPGDRDYPGATAGGTNRIVLRDGRWTSQRK